MRNNFINIATSGAVSPAGEVILEGMYVNSTSSGYIDLYHGTSDADTARTICGRITPDKGYNYLGSLKTTAGIYAALGNTINVTFHLRDEDV